MITITYLSARTAHSVLRDFSHISTDSGTIRPLAWFLATSSRPRAGRVRLRNVRFLGLVMTFTSIRAAFAKVEILTVAEVGSAKAGHHEAAPATEGFTLALFGFGRDLLLGGQIGRDGVVAAVELAELHVGPRYPGRLRAPPNQPGFGPSSSSWPERDHVDV